MDGTLWSQCDRTSLGFGLIERRRWRGVVDLWDPWEAGPATVPGVGRLQLLLARLHLAVAALAAASGRTPAGVDDLLARARALGAAPVTV